MVANVGQAVNSGADSFFKGNFAFFLYAASFLVCSAEKHRQTVPGICNKVNLFSCNIILSVIFFNQDRDYYHWKQLNFVHLNLMDCSLRRQKGINRIQLKK